MIPAALICLSLQAQESTLTVTITEIKPGPGLVRMAVCDQPGHFPDKPVLSFSIPKSEIKNNTLKIEVQNLLEGSYAISLLDDTNKDGKMELGLLGIPKEGFGFSNDIRPRGKAPPFEKCTFSVKKGENNLAIRMQYFGK